MIKIPLQYISYIFFYGLALTLLCKTFYNLFSAYKHEKLLSKHAITAKNESLFRVELIRPLIFCKYFATCLTIPFLSQYILSVTVASGMSSQASSIAYVMYQIIFMLMIVPSGYIMEAGNIKRILLITFLLEALTYVTLGVTSQFWIIIAMQIMFGIVIPVSSSAEYAYILAYSTKNNRSEALALYSNTTKGAMISGIFFGGILVGKLGQLNTLLLAGLLILSCLLYIIFFLPNIDCKTINCEKISEKVKLKSTLNLNKKDFITILKDLNFLKILFLVAFPIGILRDGVFLFSLPIVLTHNHISNSIIGQIMVLFSIGFFITNKFIAKKYDKSKNKNLFLVVGLIGTALSLTLISGLNTSHLFGITNKNFGIYLISIGLLILGLFRGFLLSPSMSSISKSEAASVIGKNVALSIYRLAEVSGKIIGPIFIATLLSLTNFSPLVFLLTGGIILIFAIILLTFNSFAVVLSQTETTKQKSLA